MPAPEAQLRLTEDRVLRRDGDVAGQCQLAASSEAVAVDRGDGRLRAVPEAHRHIAAEFEPSPGAEQIRRGAPVVAGIGFLQVVAGAEGAAGPSQHQHVHFRVPLHPGLHVHDLVNHRAADCVEHAWTVQSEHSHPTIDLELDGFVHPAHPPFRSLAGASRGPVHRRFCTGQVGISWCLGRNPFSGTHFRLPSANNTGVTPELSYSAHSLTSQRVIHTCSATRDRAPHP